MKHGTGFLRTLFFNLAIFLAITVAGLGFCEILLRVKNRDQKNYNIEMWRYSKLLKIKSSDKNLGFEHRPNTHAKLQGVEIRLNSLGMRGPVPELNDFRRKRVLFLGSSNTLGWGVAEENTMPSVLQRSLKDKAQIFNAGIGNYNTVRYVTLFEKRFIPLKPDVVVLNCFVRDAEQLEPGGGNFLLRHSELAVILYHLYYKLTHRYGSIQDLVDYYRKIYRADNRGYQEMVAAFEQLDRTAKQQGFKVILTMIPDIHLMQPYPFDFIHEDMRKIATRYDWTFVDFKEVLKQVPAQDLWAMPGDPHVNALGHKIMAKTLQPYLEY